MDQAFAWARQNGGLCSDADYPYRSGASGKAPACRAGCTPVEDSRPSRWTDVRPNSEASLMAAVAKQPVSVAIDANPKALMFYSKGVMDARCGNARDHAVLVTGYGADDDAKHPAYWTVKNSWGKTWGEDGYVRVIRGSNYCGLANFAVHSVLTEQHH